MKENVVMGTYSYDVTSHPVKLKAGDDCPKCGGQLEAVTHDYQSAGGAPDCSWLICLDCDFKTDPE